MNAKDIPIPEAWPMLIRKTVLHAISLARWCMICVYSEAAYDENHNVRTAASLGRLEDEIALLKEEIRIKDARILRIEPKRRPYYPPEERMAILTMRAARGWNLRQTAEAFHVAEETISRWMADLDEYGPNALTRLSTPVNKYPDFVDNICQQLKMHFPQCGKRKIAEYFARCGANLSATTVGRRLKHISHTSPDKSTLLPSLAEGKPVVTAKYPNHVWHVDLTAVPVGQGFWTSWVPYALPQAWPFCWWVLAIVDHYSRKCVGFALYPSRPSAQEVIKSLNEAIARHDRPKYIISDKGVQFWSPLARSAGQSRNHAYHKWCRAQSIMPRFGAIGQHGSIAIVERFMRTLKSEGTRQIIVPLDFDAMRLELALITTWYNRYRPHQSLNGATPEEMSLNAPPTPAIPIKSNSELPTLFPHITYFEGRRHLPIIELKQAA